MNYYLAIDIGASSGRHILFWKEEMQIHMLEVYRFVNESEKIKNYECWNIDKLFHNIIKGMKVCHNLKKIPCAMAIDTWGVDYVLLDDVGELLNECICYRDHSFDHVMDEVFHIISKEELYEHTGIQFQQFNTIYQLYEMSKRIDLKKANHFLMIPDYMIYLLTGVTVNEYTNATTTQLLNAKTHMWDETILERLHIPCNIFHEVIMPGTCIGTLRHDIVNEIGFQTKVWACASHDTGSAFLVPDNEDSIIISSGTWSLIGIHRATPLINQESRMCNYTNEGGWHTIRYLKNIMGLWMLQEVQRNLDYVYTFTELCELGKQSEPISTVIDVNDYRFLKPTNMIKAIDTYCTEKGLAQPKSIGQYVQCICRSLAFAYKDAIKELEQLNKRTYLNITVIGGGVQNEYLNCLISEICERPVIRGTIEATALGNAMCQMIANREFDNLQEARACELVVHTRKESEK